MTDPTLAYPIDDRLYLYVPEVTATAIHGLPGVDIAACAALAKPLGVGFHQRELDVVG